MTLRLHHSPLACSLAARFALEEAGLAHELVVVRTSRGEHLTEAYARINPNKKVPALETDDGPLTESTAILPYIADLAPAARLLPPPGGFARDKAQSWLSFLSSAVHAAWGGVIRADTFEGCEIEAVRAVFLKRLSGAFTILDEHLGRQPWLLDSFSLCDLYLLVFLLWRNAPQATGRLPQFANLDRLQQALLQRPTVQRILADDMKLRASA